MKAGLHMRGAGVTLRDGDRAFSLRIEGFDLAPGEAVALTGASGAGKTLVLELLGLLRAPGPGTVYDWTDAEGKRHDLAGLWRGGARSAALARMRGRLFGFVPQTGGLVPFLSVAENVALPQRLTGRVDAGRCRELITRLGLSDVAGLRPGALSIGQRQRTAIARALSHNPPFVIADEPTAALDPASAEAAMGLLVEAVTQSASGLILASHDLDRIAARNIRRLALQVAPRVATGGVESTLEAAPC